MDNSVDGFGLSPIGLVPQRQGLGLLSQKTQSRDYLARLNANGSFSQEASIEVRGSYAHTQGFGIISIVLAFKFELVKFLLSYRTPPKLLRFPRYRQSW